LSVSWEKRGQREKEKKRCTGELADLRGQKGEHVVTEIQDLQLPQLPDALGKGLELVVVQAQLLEVGEFSNILRQDEDVVVAGIKLHEHGEVEDVLSQRLNRVDPGEKNNFSFFSFGEEERQQGLTQW